MSLQQLNAFLAKVSSDVALQNLLSQRDAFGAVALAAELGFELTVGDLIRCKSRATSWQLSDEELAVVAQWQPQDQPYWWQLIWHCR